MRVRGSFVAAKAGGGACVTATQPRRASAWRLGVLVAMSAIPIAAHAAVYKCKKADGGTVYSDIPCGPGAQAQAIQTQPSEGSAEGSQVGAANQPADRNQTSACWLSKYDDWRTKNPQLAANSSVNLQTMQGFQRECHWSARTIATPLVSAITPASQAAMRADANRYAAAHPMIGGTRPTLRLLEGHAAGPTSSRPDSFATSASAALANSGRAQ